MAKPENIRNVSNAPLGGAATQDDREERGIGNEIRRLQKIKALLIAIQFGAEHDGEFDVPDALAGVITLIEQLLANLDQLKVAAGGEQ